MKKVFSYLGVAEFMRAGLIAFSQSFTGALETRGPSLTSIGGREEKNAFNYSAVPPESVHSCKRQNTHTHTTIIIPAQWRR